MTKSKFANEVVPVVTRVYFVQAINELEVFGQVRNMFTFFTMMILVIFLNKW